MTDPRIDRTRAHVLATVRAMLAHDGAEVTFSSIAAEAQVSRRTLYTHWGDVETLVAEALFPNDPELAERFTKIVRDPFRQVTWILDRLDEIEAKADLAGFNRGYEQANREHRRAGDGMGMV